MNRQQRRAFFKGSDLYRAARAIDAIGERIMNGSATIRDIRTLNEFEGQLRQLKDQLTNEDGRDRVDAMIIEVNALLLDARELSVVVR